MKEEIKRIHRGEARYSSQASMNISRYPDLDDGSYQFEVSGTTIVSQSYRMRLISYFPIEVGVRIRKMGVPCIQDLGSRLPKIRNGFTSPNNHELVAKHQCT